MFILNWSDYLIALLLTTREWVTIPVYMASLSSMTGQLCAKAALLMRRCRRKGADPEASGARLDVWSVEAMKDESAKLGFRLTLPASWCCSSRCFRC